MQGNLGVCWAHALAAALTIEIGTPVSPMSVVIQYNRKPNLVDAVGYEAFDGSSAIAPMSVTKRTFCPLSSEAFAAADPTVFDGSNTGESSDRTRPLQRLYRLNHLLGQRVSDDAGGAIDAAANDLISGIGNGLHALLAPTKSLEESLGESIDQNCSLKIPVARHLQAQKAFHLEGNWQRLATLIDQGFDQGKPVLIYYRAGVLTGQTLPRLIRSLISDHVSILVGRRMGAAGEMYRLRNSWGGTCYDTIADSVDADIESRCEDNGDVWLYPQELLPYVTAAAYYKTVR